MIDTETAVEPLIQIGLAELAGLLTADVQKGVFKHWLSVTVDEGQPVMVRITYLQNMDELRKVRRLLGGGDWTKEYVNDTHVEEKVFSPHLTIRLITSRASTCTKHQVGTRTVRKPDPSVVVPLVDVEEPVYEWECN